MRLKSDQVADRLQISRKYFQNSWRKIHGLPSPFRYPLENGGKSHPTWDAGEIESYISNCKEAA